MSLQKARTDYATGASRLMIHHVWFLAFKSKSEQLQIEQALDERVQLCILATGKRPKTVEESDDWIGLKKDLIKLISQHEDAKNSTSLEDASWSILKPFILSQIDADCQRMISWKDRPFGSWTYEPSGKATINLHFANASMPRSPFKGKARERTISDLLSLLQSACNEHPKVSRVRCGSWLSCFPPFNAFFPEKWGRSYKPVLKFYDSAGWWGQYSDRKGALHTKNAQSLRKTGQHPYIHGNCVCPIDEAIDHLSNLIG